MKPIKIKLIQTLDYYDGPTIFTGMANNEKFLFYMMDDGTKNRFFMMIKSDNRLLKKLVETKIDIQSFFELSSHFFIYRSDGFYKKTDIQEIKEYIPEKNIYIPKGDYHEF